MSFDLNIWFWLVLLFFILFFLHLIESVFERYPYQKKFQIMSAAEKHFYTVLKRTVGSQFEIYPQLSIGRLVSVTRGIRRSYRYWNKISQKSVDFVLVDPQTTQPVLVIELDDVSHSLPTRIQRDGFVVHVFKDVGIPIMHQNVFSSYDELSLRQQIDELLGVGQGA